MESEEIGQVNINKYAISIPLHNVHCEVEWVYNLFNLSGEAYEYWT